MHCTFSFPASTGKRLGIRKGSKGRVYWNPATEAFHAQVLQNGSIIDAGIVRTKTSISRGKSSGRTQHLIKKLALQNIGTTRAHPMIA
jgi:hypothetical protein